MNPKRKTQDISPRNIKDINVSLIQSCIYKKGPISRIGIATETNSSTATVSRAVNFLLTQNIVKNVGTLRSEGAGRKTELIEFNYNYSSIIGLHIQEHYIEIALCDLKGKIIRQNKVPLKSEKDDFLQTIFNLIDGVLKDSYIGKLLTISVACPGLVDFDSGKIRQSLDIPVLQDVLLKEALESRYQVPVSIDNDVNIAAIGEYSFYKADNIHDLAYFEFGPGIGAGIIIGGELYRGHASGAGELAYYLFDEENLYDNNQAQHFLMKMQGQKLDDGVINKIAMIICNYTCILNPQLIVIDGDFVNAWRDILLEKVRQALEVSYPLAPEIKTSRPGTPSKLVGAIKTALESAVQILRPHGVYIDID